MIWFALGIVIIAVILVMRNRNGIAAETATETVPACGAASLPGMATEDDDEILAVITAAIAEFEGDHDLQIASIKRRSNNWKLTGLQELVSGRLN